MLDYCYHWLTIDFSVTVHYGSNSHGGINYIQHLLRACSDLEDDEKLYGITYDNERFSITINNTFVNLE